MCARARARVPDVSSLHFCAKTGGIVRFSVGGANSSVATTPKPLTTASPTTSDVILVYKSGPDCGLLNVTIDGVRVLEFFDTFSTSVDWSATQVLARGMDTSKQHIIELVVTGSHRQESSNSWVQIVGVQVWDLHTRTFAFLSSDYQST